MKYLLVLMVVAVAIWLWRRNRQEEMDEKAQAPRAAPPSVGPPQSMVRCAHCGLHLPANDAIGGAHGSVYCSAAHREAATR